jgi:hypothetical protein
VVPAVIAKFVLGVKVVWQPLQSAVLYIVVGIWLLIEVLAIAPYSPWLVYEPLWQEVPQTVPVPVWFITYLAVPPVGSGVKVVVAAVLKLMEVVPS